MSEEKGDLLSTSEYVKCPACGEVVKAKGKYGHFSQRHSDLNYNEYKDKFEPAPPPKGAKEEGVWKEGADANRILEQVLQSNPDIAPKHVREIMSWAELRGQLHPMEVAHLLNNMKGISSQTANIVSQKYAFALQKAATEGKAQISIGLIQPPLLQSQGQFPMTGGWLTQPGTGLLQQPEQTPFMTKEEYEKRERERRTETEMTGLRGRVDKMDKDFGEALSGLEDRLSEKIGTGGWGTQFEEIREPIDKDGNVCDPEKAVSIRIRRVPIASRESTEVKELREEIKGLHKTIQDKEIASIKEDMKEIKGLISKKPEKPEESPEIKELKTRFDQVVTKYDELKEKMESKERKDLEDTIKDLRTQLTTLLSRPAGEYKGDEYRLLSDALGRLSTALEGRKPAEVAERILTGVGPSSATVPSEAHGDLEELRKKGLVVRLIERRR